MNRPVPEPDTSAADPGTLQSSVQQRPDQAMPLSSRRWERFPGGALAFILLLLAITLVPPARDNVRLTWSIVAVSGGLLIWALILWAIALRSGRAFPVDYFAVKAHYVQASVQFCILLYWGLFWKPVYVELPLILSQIAFFYSLDALLSWSRGRRWRLGFGPLPIIISTNLLLWFKHDWYIYQYLMLATGAIAKQFITWERDGRRTHIFNPSAFGQFLFAIVLIATATSNEYTWGKEIAASFDTPYMLLVLFAGGLIVQYLFHVTLMTVAATATLVLVNLVYTQITGVYYFVNINIAAPIFLGLHLLITDPATSPRTNIGRVIFGVLYGLGYAILFRVLDLYEIPLFWDKLLPVPFLNLCVPLLDRAMRSGIIGRWNQAWEAAMRPHKLNLVHMGCWAALFAVMWFSGFIEAPHPGSSVTFWKQALAEGKPHAGHSLVMAAGAQAEGRRSGAAFNELGLICMEGKLVNQNRPAAAHYFADACQLGNTDGCVNLVIQFLFLGERRSDEDVARALDHLEWTCSNETDWKACYLVATAYETGRGRPADLRRAINFYERCGTDNIYACKGLARIGLAQSGLPYNLGRVVPTLVSACEAGDAESCWYLAYMHQSGRAFQRNDFRARFLLQRACELGSQQACDALTQAVLPPFARPMMVVPGWSTAFPIDESESASLN